MKTLGPCDVRSYEAQSHTPCNRCVRFATTVASGHATLATKQDATLYLGRTFTGWIAPALPGARSGRDVRFIARPPHRTVRAAFPHTAPNLGCVTANCRMRSSACDTLIRFCARHVLCWPAFPLVPALRSIGSAALAPVDASAVGCSALFAGFSATMARSDFSCPCIIGYGSSPSRCGPPYLAHTRQRRQDRRYPRFRYDPFARDVALDPGRASAPRMAMPHMLPSSE